MPANTVPRGYTYPLYSDPINIASDIQELAQDIDADVQGFVDLLDRGRNRPAARVESGVSQSVPVSASRTTLTFATQLYDNAALYDPAFPNQITLIEQGMYLVSARANFQSNATANYGIELAILSSAGFISVPSVRSIQAWVDQSTSITTCTLHYTTGAAPDVLTVAARHNSASAVTSNARSFAVSKVSNLPSGD